MWKPKIGQRVKIIEEVYRDAPIGTIGRLTYIDHFVSDNDREYFLVDLGSENSNRNSGEGRLPTRSGHWYYDRHLATLPAKVIIIPRRKK